MSNRQASILLVSDTVQEAAENTQDTVLIEVPTRFLVTEFIMYVVVVTSWTSTTLNHIVGAIYNNIIPNVVLASTDLTWMDFLTVVESGGEGYIFVMPDQRRGLNFIFPMETSAGNVIRYRRAVRMMIEPNDDLRITLGLVNANTSQSAGQNKIFIELNGRFI